ncbi:GyrI-like domain-containing protein [Actinopolymorpha alba]|uniref:GyrI-like domain-containing protein n=1 Tax=Actinopolymorpha alba TaxID=533267 RepID=UPI00036CC306|nr:GyrI-like domain-containing protein [Actinopolymorpha alba]
MQPEPQIVDRAEQPYVGILGVVSMDTIAEIADRIPDIFAWLGARGIQPAGPPFFKYNRIDMERQLEIEVGFPVNSAVEGEGEIRPGVLPAGRYATVTHVGHPDQLVGVTGALLEWAAERGLRWDMSEEADGDRWGCRLEFYHSNPAEVPDMNDWETELAFRLADSF